MKTLMTLLLLSTFFTACNSSPLKVTESTSSVPTTKVAPRIPENCLAWYDGCNNCAKSEDGQVICTMNACPISRLEDFKCIKWKD